MDLGIRGRRAIVCGASRGLGFGSALALAREGVDLVISARRPDVLADAAKRIADETGVSVVAVAADVTTEAGRAEVLAAAPRVDILVTNAGGPPPGDFRKFGRADWIRAVDANMLTPIEFIRATVDGMIERRFGRIVNITSSAVKAPIDILALSNGARSGLTGFVAGTSRQVAQHGVTINNLLPGQHETDRITSLMENTARTRGIPVDQVRADAYAMNPARRFGTIEEFGAACAFLCSVHAGYIVGQNLLIDGGAVNSTMG